MLFKSGGYRERDHIREKSDERNQGRRQGTRRSYDSAIPASSYQAGTRRGRWQGSVGRDESSLPDAARAINPRLVPTGGDTLAGRTLEPTCPQREKILSRLRLFA
jgi:hypothetical protein